jgi:hypothetical protein
MKQADAITVLAKTTCRCGKPKKRGEAFCADCYIKLPSDFRTSLYKRLGHGFEEAYERAVGFLVLREPCPDCVGADPACQTCGGEPFEDD